MKRYGTWFIVGLLAISSIGCARGRTSWFNRGAPCSTCGQTAPVYNGAMMPPGTPPPLPETIPPAG